MAFVPMGNSFIRHVDETFIITEGINHSAVLRHNKNAKFDPNREGLINRATSYP